MTWISRAEPQRKRCNIQVLLTPSALLPDLIEMITLYLPSSSDMFLLLSALPDKYLTRALDHLKQVMLESSIPRIFHWPKLYSIVQLENLQKANTNIMLLYSRIDVDSIEDCALVPKKCKIEFSYPWAAQLNYVNLLQLPNIFALDILPTYYELDNKFVADSLRFANSLILSNLKKLSLRLNIAAHQTLFADIVRSFDTASSVNLVSLTLGFVKSDFYDELNDEFCSGLAILAKKIKKIKLKFTQVGPKRIGNYFKDCSPWLMAQSSSVSFKNNKLSKLTVSTNQVYGVADCLRGKDLSQLSILSTTYRSCVLPINYILNTLFPMKNLRRLMIDSFNLDTMRSQLITQLMPRLKELHFSNSNLVVTRINDHNASILAQNLPNCLRLQCLAINRQQLSDKAAVDIADSIARGSSIRKLNLEFNQIGDQGAIALSKVMHRLDNINLNQNQIGYVGAIAISKVMDAVTHVYIQLSYNPLTIAGVQAILASIKSHRVCEISLRGTIEDTELANSNCKLSEDELNKLLGDNSYRLKKTKESNEVDEESDSDSDYRQSQDSEYYSDTE